MNILLGLSGKPRSGKDTVASILQTDFGFRVYSFADYLKWLCVKYFDVDKDLLWGKKTKETRRLLQNVGALLTDIDTYFFVKRVVDKIKTDYESYVHHGKPFRAVITDVRREDETKLFTDNDSLFLESYQVSDDVVGLRNMFHVRSLIKIERPLGDPDSLEEGLTDALHHPVEALPDRADIKWNYIIYNDSTLQALRSTVHRMVCDLSGGVLVHDKH